MCVCVTVVARHFVCRVGCFFGFETKNDKQVFLDVEANESPRANSESSHGPWAMGYGPYVYLSMYLYVSTL